MPRAVVVVVALPDDDSVEVGWGWRLVSLLVVLVLAFEVVAEAEMLRRLLLPTMLRLDAALRSLGMKMPSREAIVRRRFLGCVSFIGCGGGWFSLSSVVVESWCCSLASPASAPSSSSSAAARLVPRDEALAGE